MDYGRRFEAWNDQVWWRKGFLESSSTTTRIISLVHHDPNNVDKYVPKHLQEHPSCDRDSDLRERYTIPGIRTKATYVHTTPKHGDNDKTPA